MEGISVHVRCSVQTPMWEADKDGLEHGISAQTARAAVSAELKEQPLCRGTTASSGLCAAPQLETYGQRQTVFH